MANFITQLSKGFVRSAVNQVGRDYGKTISNQIFGDAHASPVRMVRKDKSYIAHSLNNIEQDGSTEVAYHKQEIFTWQDIACLILSPLVIIVGPLVYGVYAAYYLFKNSTTFIVWSDCPKRIADRRHKCGYRLEAQGIHKEKLEVYNRYLDSKTIWKGKIKGFIWLVSLGITLVVNYFLFNI